MKEKIWTIKEILNNNIDKNAYGFIYITTNMVNAKRYIGQKKFDKYNSWKYYQGSGKIFIKAVKLYGRKNFKRDIIDIAYSKDEINNKEIEYIKKYQAVKRKDFYNIAIGGHNSNSLTPRTLSIETREKISEAVRGKNHPLYGIKMSEETKQKISKAHMGKQMSDKARHNMSVAQTGRKHTKETLKKMSIAQKGHEGLNFTKEDKRYRSQIVGGDIILQFDLTGKFINNYISSHEAEDNGFNRANIVKCCKHKQLQSKGYIWLYQQEYLKNGDKIVKDIIHNLNCRNPDKIKYKPVIQMDKNYNIIKQYDNITLASQAVNVCISSISNVCKGREHCHTAGGYIWKYADT